jgi:hypothetical protein
VIQIRNIITVGQKSNSIHTKLKWDGNSNFADNDSMNYNIKEKHVYYYKNGGP